MKTFKFSLFYSFAFLFVLSITSCGSDGPGDVDCTSSIAVNNAISDEVDGISVALQDYINDDSAANCDALKDAYQDYIDALKDLQDCADQAGDGASFAQALVDAEASIDTLLC